jgi:hypothetical protein
MGFILEISDHDCLTNLSESIFSGFVMFAIFPIAHDKDFKWCLKHAPPMERATARTSEIQ